MAEPDLSTASNGFLIWHGACLVVRETSRTKENPSNGHLPRTPPQVSGVQPKMGLE